MAKTIGLIEEKEVKEEKKQQAKEKEVKEEKK